MKYINYLLIGLVFCGLFFTELFSEVVKKDNIEVELISENESIQAGKPFYLAVRFKMDKGWHIYWKNPGDSGLATKISFTLPKGFKLDQMEWPYPKVFKEGPVAVYGYEKEIFILQKVYAPSNLKVGTKININAKAEWLICKEVCLPPADTELQIKLEVKSEAPKILTKWIDSFKKIREKLALNESKWEISTGIQGDKLFIILKPPVGLKKKLTKIDFFPFDVGIISYSSSQVFNIIEDGYVISINRPDNSQKSVPVKRVQGILVSDIGWNEGSVKKALRIDAEISKLIILSLVNPSSENKTKNHKDKINWEPFTLQKFNELRSNGKAIFIDFTADWCLTCKYNKLTTLRSPLIVKKFKELGIVTLIADWTKEDKVITSELKKYNRIGVPLNVYYASGADSKPIIFPEILTPSIVLEALEKGKLDEKKESSIFLIFLFSLIGGLILNIMPCVFPVLSIKVLNIVEQVGEEKAKIKIHGFIYTLGVVLSFWILAILIIVLGKGWGFQLQNPPFVMILTLFLFLFGLNLLGVFELGLSFSRVGKLSSNKSSYANSFLIGILATVVGAPCLAPFMGVATGVALVNPVWWKTLSIFTLIGLGMAIPFLLLAFFPVLLNKIPKPGRWMESFKQFMGFLLLGTVALLIWLIGELTDMQGVGLFMIAILLMGLSAWVYGRWGTLLQSVKTRNIARVITVILIIFGIFIALHYSKSNSTNYNVESTNESNKNSTK